MWRLKRSKIIKDRWSQTSGVSGNVMVAGGFRYTVIVVTGIPFGDINIHKGGAGGLGSIIIASNTKKSKVTKYFTYSSNSGEKGRNLKLNINGGTKLKNDKRETAIFHHPLMHSCFRFADWPASCLLSPWFCFQQVSEVGHISSNFI